MDGLINAILRLSREGGRTLTATPVELNALFTQSEASLRHQLDEVGATLTVAPNLPKVTSDQMALEQIFGNLLDNAIKYLAPGRPGRIEVRARNGEAGQIVVEVVDNGRGIAAQDQERVFELSRRGHRTCARARPGQAPGRRCDGGVHGR
jgi:signal transduction histidine kinase